ncbi:MAG: DUF350 domain-containing protein [Planctomycetaceae bacterium]
MPSIFEAYLITFGWAITGAISMGIGIIIAVRMFDFSTKVDEWKLIEQGNIAMAIVLASVIISVAMVIAAAVG